MGKGWFLSKLLSKLCATLDNSFILSLLILLAVIPISSTKIAILGSCPLSFLYVFHFNLRNTSRLDHNASLGDVAKPLAKTISDDPLPFGPDEIGRASCRERG